MGDGRGAGSVGPRLRALARRPLALVAGAVVLLAAALALWRLPEPEEPAAVRPAAIGRSAAGLSTVPVGRERVEEVSEAVGTVRARIASVLSSKATGRVLEVRVRAGAVVERGQPLVVLAGEETRARVAQARAALRAAETTLADAERDLRRMRQLAAEGIVARRDLDAAEARAEVARARVGEATSALRETEAQAGDLVVHAPASGVVAETHVEPGELAAPGRPLVSLYDPRHLRLEAPVREELARELLPGQKVEVAIDALGLEVAGTVEVVVPEADPATRAFLVKVSLPPRDGLYPGMFGRLRFPVGTAEIVAVPRRAVSLVGQLETVEVVEDDVVRTRQVRTGKRYGELVEVLAGLEPGERVVVPPGPTP